MRAWMLGLPPEELADRAAINDVVLRFCGSFDDRDWAAYAAVLADPVSIDYRAFDPRLDLTMPSRDWAEMVGAAVAEYDGTHHTSTNHVHNVVGDNATCRTHVQGAHFLTVDNVQLECTIYGYYTFTLRRAHGGWLIEKVTLDVTGRRGDPRVFTIAAERVQARQAAP